VLLGISLIIFFYPIIHKGKIISFKFSFYKYNITTAYARYARYAKDSYLLLPNYLNKLCKSFSVQSQKKGIFPYSLMDIEYVGDVPNFKYLFNIDAYENYKNHLFLNMSVAVI